MLVNIANMDIKKKLTRLYNLEKLHSVARERIVLLEKENRQLKLRIKELEDQNKDRDTKLEAVSFQLEQIKIKLFGQKPTPNRLLRKKEKKDRNIFSYHRPLPTEITETKFHVVTDCLHCHGKLEKKFLRTFFEEDIPLPIQKIVIKHEVETGYCENCHRQSSGTEIPSKKTVLGNNLKKYVCILSIANRLSHNQIKENLQDLFHFSISLGEIGNILETEANNLRPKYQTLKQSFLSQTGVHYDETSWSVQKEEQGKFAWVATGTENNDTVFALGKSRGKGNIADLGIGKIGISDDYGAYKNSFKEHQLCWAHPKRKLRDLAESGEFGKRKKKQIFQTYDRFSNLYHEIREVNGTEISPHLQKKFQRDFQEITENHSHDPTPLTKIKMSLQKNIGKYFTFLKYPNLPIDNNKAERALRHLVIKRRTSFGSKTQRGAETTSILASIILSLKWNDPKDWFKSYLQLKG